MLNNNIYNINKNKYMINIIKNLKIIFSRY